MLPINTGDSLLAILSSFSLPIVNLPLADTAFPALVVVVASIVPPVIVIVPIPVVTTPFVPPVIVPPVTNTLPVLLVHIPSPDFPVFISPSLNSTFPR